MAYSRKKTLKDGSVRYYAAYLGADGRYHEEGGFSSKREADRVAGRREVDAGRGDWTNPAAGRLNFNDYLTTYYWPTTAHLEVSTRAAYRYYLDRHFIPHFGAMPMRRISPSVVQAWVNQAATTTLSARSIVKYHAPAAQDLRARRHRPHRPG